MWSNRTNLFLNKWLALSENRFESSDYFFIRLDGSVLCNDLVCLFVCLWFKLKDRIWEFWFSSSGIDRRGSSRLTSGTTPTGAPWRPGKDDSVSKIFIFGNSYSQFINIFLFLFDILFIYIYIFPFWWSHARSIGDICVRLFCLCMRSLSG